MPGLVFRLSSSCRNIFLDSFRDQLYPILAILALSFFVGIGSWISRLFGSKKLEKEVLKSLSAFPNVCSSGAFKEAFRFCCQVKCKLCQPFTLYIFDDQCLFA